MYRVLACDMDGTILKDDKTISQETIDELKRITDEGVIFLPSTGRTHRELPTAIRDLPFIHYALCCNGGAIYNYLEGKYIYEKTIPYNLALEVLEYAKNLPLNTAIVVNGQRIATGDDNDEICEYVRKVAVPDILFNFVGAHDVKEAFAQRKQGAQKILFYVLQGADKQDIQNTLSSKFPDLAVSSSGPLFIEVNIKGVDKGEALKDFCKYMNIPIEESIAFGDAQNDISMLKAAGMSVVTANGTDETKKYADMICPSNNDDGVCKTIKKIWKNN